MRKIEFYKHNLGDAELASVGEALESLFLTAGPRTRQFEEKFARYLGVSNVVGLYSCTSALFLAQKALGIGPGDEVITTPMTFIATSNTIMEAGATPVFVDVEPDTGLINPDKIEQAITSRTKAIIPVHLYGLMCDMKHLRSIADAYGLAIIEDAAHCVEGIRDGVKPGQLGDIACFSFYATKNLCSGEGGALATNNSELAHKILLMRSHGMNKEAANRYHAKYNHWDMVTFGYKANMYDLQAALLLPQLPLIDQRLSSREMIFQSYYRALEGLDGLTWPVETPNVRHARHLFTVWVRPEIRDAVLDGLNDAGIGCAVNYRAVHLLSYYTQKFGYKPGAFPNAEKIGDRTISLPLWVGLPDSDIVYVAEKLKALCSAGLTG